MLVNTEYKENPVQRYQKRLKTAFDEQMSQGWISHWRELSEYYMPYRGRNLFSKGYSENNDGHKKGQKIINAYHQKAVRTIAAGLQGGLTSPSRPWFTLGLDDEDLAEYEPVRIWLHKQRQRMLSVLARSNFYGSCHKLYQELAVFGTGCMFADEDFESAIRYRTFTIGEFAINLDSNGRADSLFRQFVLTVNQLIEMFGLESVKQEHAIAYKDNRGDMKVDVCHVIQKASQYNPSKGDHRGMPWKSCYFYKNDESHGFLREGGYRSQPFFAPAWDRTATDTYGISPGMLGLPDVKQLQKMEKDKLKAIGKNVTPTVNAPSSMKEHGVSFIEGDANYIDPNQGGQSVVPMHVPTINLGDLRLSIQEVEQRIESFFYGDLFLAIIGQEKNMTATEVSQRYEEKMMMLGPIIEILQADYLDPVIDRLYDVMWNLEMIDPPPQELGGGTNIKVEYISLLAQAQRMIGLQSIERFTTFAGGIIQMNPQSALKVNFNEILDQHAMDLGLPPTCVNSDDVVQQQEQAMQQKQQMAQMAQMAPQLAGAAKHMGETTGEPGTAMGAILGK